MLPNQSHAPTMLAYHAPASPPATAALVDLQSDIDRLGTKIARAPLANCDTRNLQDAADVKDRLLDLVISLSQLLEAEIVERRRATAPSYKITTVGLMLLDPRPVLTPEARVRLAEDEARAEREERALAFSFTPNRDAAPVPHEHPDNCPCDGCVAKALREGQDALRSLATANTSLDSERRCG